MAHHSRNDDYDDEDDRPRRRVRRGGDDDEKPGRRGMPAWVWAIILVCGLPVLAIAVKNGYEAWERHEARNQLREMDAARAKKDAGQEQMRGRIEKQARIDAMDFMRQRESKDRVFSDFTVKEVVVSNERIHLGFGIGDDGYRGDMIVTIKSNIGVVSNITTHRLELRYLSDGTFKPDLSEVERIGNLDLDSPLLKR